MKPPTPSQSPAGPWWIGLLLAVIAVVAYHNSFNGVFVFDDHDSIVRNPHLERLGSMEDLISANPQTTLSGRPVLVLSLALNRWAGGTDVVGYHVLNLLIHILSGLTLYGIVRRTLILRKAPAAAKAAWVAAAVAGIWLAHPLQTSAVTYIVQRAESLMGLFYLLTLWCFIRGVQGRATWYGASIACCALAMGCKESAASAPLMVLIYDWVFVGGSVSQILRRRAAVYGGLAGTWLIVAAIALSGIRSQSVGFGFGINGLDYLRTQAGVIAWYLRLSFWPAPLALSYNWPIARSVGEIWPQGLLIVALLGGTAWGVWRRSWLGFAGAWFFLILAPSSSVLPVVTEIMAEHRMYLPLAAVIAAVVGIFGAAVNRLPRRGALAGAVAGGCIVALMVVTVRRNAVYASEWSIWQDNVASQANDYRAHYNLGQALDKSKDRMGAIAEYRKSLQIEPNYSDAHYRLGLSYESLGRAAEAIEHYRRATELDRDLFEAHYRIAFLLAQRQEWSGAIEHFRAAVRLRPRDAEAHLYLGLALKNAGQSAEAMHYIQRALQLNPSLKP